MPEQKPPKKKILVVDDEPQVCGVVKMLLEFDGHEVVTASNGQEALTLFEQGKFDLVITDYTMPGMKGDELALALKAHQPGQPVVMLTAHAEMLKTETVPLLGVDQLVSKPFLLADLRDAIQKATAR
jgi:two-component system, cell cycle response regulator CpdR